MWIGFALLGVFVWVTVKASTTAGRSWLAGGARCLRLWWGREPYAAGDRAAASRRRHLLITNWSKLRLTSTGDINGTGHERQCTIRHVQPNRLLTPQGSARIELLKRCSMRWTSVPGMDLAEAQRIAVSFFASRMEDAYLWEVRASSRLTAARPAEEQALIFEFRPPHGHAWQRSWPPLRVTVDPHTGRADMLR